MKPKGQDKRWCMVDAPHYQGPEISKKKTLGETEHSSLLKKTKQLPPKQEKMTMNWNGSLDSINIKPTRSSSVSFANPYLPFAYKLQFMPSFLHP